MPYLPDRRRLALPFVGGKAADGSQLGDHLFDLASFSFDFTTSNPDVSAVEFEFVFASDEYGQFNFNEFANLFGLFVNGENYARVPGIGAFVTENDDEIAIDSVNIVENSELYVDNNIDQRPDPSGSLVRGTYNINVSGFTTVIRVVAPILNNGQSNHVEFAVANEKEGHPISALFLSGFRAIEQAPNDAAGDALANVVAVAAQAAEAMGLTGRAMAEYIQAPFLAALQKSTPVELVGSYAVIAFDPVDWALRDSNGRELASATGSNLSATTGVRVYGTGNGAIEIAVIPNAVAGRYNLELRGVGHGNLAASGNLFQSSGAVTSILLQGRLANAASTAVALDFTNPTGNVSFISIGSAAAPISRSLFPTSFVATATTAFQNLRDATVSTTTNTFNSTSAANSTGASAVSAKGVARDRRDIGSAAAATVKKVNELLDTLFATTDQLMSAIGLDRFIDARLDKTQQAIAADILKVVDQAVLRSFVPGVDAVRSVLKMQEAAPKKDANDRTHSLPRDSHPAHPQMEAVANNHAMSHEPPSRPAS